MYFVGILSVFVGYIITNSIYRPKEKLKEKREKHEVIKRSILVLLSFISLYIFIWKSILAIPSWLSGGQGELKSDIIMEGTLLLGGFWDVLFTYVAKPIHITLVIYCVVLIFQKKKDPLIFTLTLLVLFFGFLSSASRFSLLEIVEAFFAFWFLFSGLSFKTLLNRFKGMSLFLGATVLIIFFFMLENGSLGSGFYVYLCGCIPCSDINLDRLDMGYLYGLVTLNGVIRVVLQIPKMLGLVGGVWPVLDTIFEYMIRFEETTYIADDVRYNAFVSMFTYFYADGGLTGVIIFSLLTGALFSFINKRATTNPTYQSCGLAMYVVILISVTMVRAQTFLVPPVMTMVWIYFLLPKKEVLKHKVG